jgi:hypothetical protein
MRLEPLYRVRFTYSDGWGADLAGPDNAECQFFFLAEGRCEGRIAGRFIGANHPHRRSDGRRQIVTSATHLSEDERYHWLNDSLSVGVGEVRSQEDGPTELVIEWAEVVWEPIAD